MKTKGTKLYDGLTSHEAKGSGYSIIGKTIEGCFVRACEPGKTSHLMYEPVYASSNSSGSDAIGCVGFWTPEKILPLSKKDKKYLDKAFPSEFISCEECGMQHDSDDYQPNYRVTDECSVYCLECVPDDKKLKQVIKPEDVFKAPRVDESSLPKSFVEIETLFCDSSGFGGSNEPALTKQGVIQTVSELLKKHKTLYAGLTGVGQFQVYVTLYKRRGGK